MRHTQKTPLTMTAEKAANTSLFETAFTHAQVGMAISSVDGTLLSVNHSFAALLGRTPAEIVGLNYRAITAPGDETAAEDYTQRLFLDGETSHTVNKRYVSKSGDEVHARVTLTLVPHSKRDSGFIIIQAVDISEMTRSEQCLVREIEKKDILLKEVHHRVKNNFQVVTSLLNLQEKMVDDVKIAEALSESKLRIRSMALIHERLYHSDDTSRIMLGDYVESVISDLGATLRGTASGIEFITKIARISLDLSKAVPIGLIVNEAVTNSLKYAFRPPFSGRAKVEVKGEINGKNLVLTIMDNGNGIDPSVRVENPSTLGIYLITMLTRQLKGDHSVCGEGGTKYVITLPYAVS